ncbi:hypothetical protein J421_6319 (plasmid) [Gemmatirosa kalamazoonensis]|uniref:Methyltransferase type 11 n=1 Tax=Gemmatirosa kalamazoonensis TaxID=861299 RepID=W0RS97_9BACT|nr:class I SAM-dependent methyltransferase [Gemmatirosa kalamazoonensis]AHG93854.1 hypothetical protein J421_6319 [Gemmatirosa kalamazoonensis]
MTTATYELTACPVCGHAPGDTLADGDALRAEQERLWAFHDARLRPGVPVERLVDRVAFSQRLPLGLARCAQCTLVYRNPRERDIALREAYADEAVEADALRALHDTQRDAYGAQAERLEEVLGRRGRVLEVGSYVGGFLAAAARRGWRATGIDINAAALAVAREAVGDDVEVEEADLDGYAARGDTVAGAFDAVAVWNCFEQLPDPRGAAHRTAALLGAGGVLALRVPNGAFYAAIRERLDGPLGPVAERLLAHNNLLAFPYRHGFTPGSLRRLLEPLGFEVVRVYGDALVPIADEWTRPWAAWEERLLKGALRLLAGDEAEWAPWLEVYARRRA